MRLQRSLAAEALPVSLFTAASLWLEPKSALPWLNFAEPRSPPTLADLCGALPALTLADLCGALPAATPGCLAAQSPSVPTLCHPPSLTLVHGVGCPECSVSEPSSCFVSPR